jgi:hypothetical protein
MVKMATRMLEVDKKGAARRRQDAGKPAAYPIENSLGFGGLAFLVEHRQWRSPGSGESATLLARCASLRQARGES